MTMASGLLMRGKGGVRSMTNEIVLDKEFRVCSIISNIVLPVVIFTVARGLGRSPSGRRAAAAIQDATSRQVTALQFQPGVSMRQLSHAIDSDQLIEALSSQCAMPQQGADQADCCVDRALRLRESGADGRRRRDCCGPWSYCRGEAAWSREGPCAAPLAAFGGRATRLRDRRQQARAQRRLGPRDACNRAAESC